MVWRDLKVRYKQSVLGALWAIIQPVATMIIMTIFFGKLAGFEDDIGDKPYEIWFYAGNLSWLYFQASLTLAANSLVGNVDLITKVYFPRLTIPAASVVSGLVDFLIASAVLLVLCLFFGVLPHWTMVFWPFLLLPAVLLALGLGMFLAVLNVKYRDIKYTIPFFTQLLFFITPVIYPASKVPEEFHAVYALNPMVGVVEAMRYTSIGGEAFPWLEFSLSAGISTVTFLLCLLHFRKSQETFADII